MAPKSVLALLATASGDGNGDAADGLAGLAEAIAGLRTEDARATVLEWLSERGAGRERTTYRCVAIKSAMRATICR